MGHCLPRRRGFRLGLLHDDRLSDALHSMLREECAQMEGPRCPVTATWMKGPMASAMARAALRECAPPPEHVAAPARA